MTIEEFIGGREAASPIEIDRDDISTSELNITQLSLPDSFDESLCLDLYNEFNQSHCKSSMELASEKTRAIGPCVVDQLKPLDGISHQNDLELKLRELLSANLQLREKGRMYDSMKKRSSENETVIEDLRSQMQHYKSLNDSAIVREKELNHQILGYKRKVHLIGIDLGHSQKESEILFSRAEKAEKEHQACASSLRKCEIDLSRLNVDRDEAKAQYTREIARVREECNNELMSSRSQQSEASARESKVLRDARDQAIDQTKLLHQELSELRTVKDDKESENADIIKELESQLADTRSNLKVKSCELNTLQTCQDRTVREAADLQKKHSILERQSSKLEEAIRQKNEALELYHHDDLLVDCDAEDVKPNSAGFKSGRRTLVKNSVALARKCRELQSLLRNKINELAILNDTNQALSKKEESNQRLFRELTFQNNKTASAYIISALSARDNEILKLSSTVNLLQSNLRELVQERDDLLSKLAQMLERRQQLEEMKGLVDSMRHASIGAVTPCAGHDKHTDDGNDMENDLLDHITHHRSSEISR